MFINKEKQIITSRSIPNQSRLGHTIPGQTSSKIFLLFLKPKGGN